MVTFKFDFHILKKRTHHKQGKKQQQQQTEKRYFQFKLHKIKEKLVYRIQTPTQYKDCKGRVNTKRVILIMVGEEQREIRMGQATEAHI